METNKAARLAFGIAIVAAFLSALPIIAMGGATLARLFGDESLRHSLAPLAYLAQTAFCWINWFLLSPVIVVTAVVATVWSVRGKTRGSALAAASILLALVADAASYYSVNYWAR